MQPIPGPVLDVFSVAVSVVLLVAAARCGRAAVEDEARDAEEWGLPYVTCFMLAAAALGVILTYLEKRP